MDDGIALMNASATVTAGSTTTLASNYYDNAGANSCGALQDQSGNYLHGDMNYGTTFTYRGNLTWSNNLGDVRCTAFGSTGVPYHGRARPATGRPRAGWPP